MSANSQEDARNEESFSWETWFRMGLRAFKKTLARYNLGLPNEFWQHLEKSLTELLAAMRIAIRVMRDRRRGVGSPSASESKSIDIKWDDWDDDEWSDWE